MATFPARISTPNLRVADVPDPFADWPVIGRFALTFDPEEHDPYHLEDQDLSALSTATTLVLLRAHLFFEQRRWNHLGRPPDEAAITGIRRIVGLIRAKLSEQAIP